MRPLSIMFVLILGLVITACKRTGEGEQPQASTVDYTLVDDHLFHFGFGVIETSQAITDFSGILTIAGQTISATVDGANRIIFGVPESVPAGNQTLQVSINGEIGQDLAIQIESLPTINDPKQLVQDYKVQLGLFDQRAKALFDSTSKRFNVNPAYNPDLAAGVYRDSLAVYLDAFDAASPEEQMNAAKVISAQFSDIKGLIDDLNETIFLMSISSNLQLKASPCANESEISQAWLCVLQQFGQTMRSLLINAGVSWALGGAVGGIIGALASSGIGTLLGAKIGLGVASFFVAASIFNFLSANLSNLKAAFIVTAQNISKKKALNFISDESTPFTYRVARRNIQGSDLSDGPEFVKAYLSVYTDFVAKVKENFKDRADDIPEIQALRTANSGLESLSYLNFEVKDNANVELISLDGTAESPALTFQSSDPTEQSFTLVARYNDGVFEIEEEFDATLGASDITWYTGTYELLMYGGYDSACSPNEGQKGDIYFCTYISSDDQERAVVFFKSVLNGISDTLKEMPFELNNGFAKSVYFSATDSYVSFTKLISNAQKIETESGVSNTSYIYLKAPGGNGTGCGNSLYDYYYRAKILANNAGSSAPSGLSPSQLQNIYTLMK